MAPDKERMRFTDPRAIGTGVAAIGIMAAAALNYVTIVTPECKQCQIDLAVCQTKITGLEKDVTRLTERVAAEEKAVDKCEIALRGG